MYDPAKITLKTERIRYWMDQGALPTDTVQSLLKKEGFFTANA
jgi:small subunit ribosomal protein S16